MDTLEPATIDTTEMEVVAISSTNTLCVFDQSEAVLLSKGGAAPLELGDSASEGEEQDHEDEVEVIQTR